jgi:hypothetical protein
MDGKKDDIPDWELPPLDEWVVDELTRTRDALSDLMERHENIVNHLADVCRRNDKMQAAGDALVQLLHDMSGWAIVEKNHGDRISELTQKWGESSV